MLRLPESRDAACVVLRPEMPGQARNAPAARPPPPTLPCRIKNKLDIVRGLMDCLLAKVIPCVTTCVIAELEKLGPKFRVALRLAKDPRFRRIRTEGDYADDNIVKLVTESKCYIVATCDKDLQRRIRKIPGVPIISIKSRRFTVERMPEAIGAPR